MQTTAEKLREEGRIEGIALGEERGEARGEARGKTLGEVLGRTAGQRQVIDTLLQRRFGAIPTRLANKLAKASDEHLAAIALRLLDAKSIDDVFA